MLNQTKSGMFCLTCCKLLQKIHQSLIDKSIHGPGKDSTKPIQAVRHSKRDGHSGMASSGQTFVHPEDNPLSSVLALKKSALLRWCFRWREALRASRLLYLSRSQAWGKAELMWLLKFAESTRIEAYKTRIFIVYFLQHIINNHWHIDIRFAVWNTKWWKWVLSHLRMTMPSHAS